MAKDQISDTAGKAAYGTQNGMSVLEWVAAGLALVWLVAIGAYVLTAPEGAGKLGLVLALLVVFLPLALILAAVVTLRSVRALRGEAQRLQATVEAMRAA